MAEESGHKWGWKDFAKSAAVAVVVLYLWHNGTLNFLGFDKAAKAGTSSDYVPPVK